jgi:hypothetical protein
VETTKNSGDFNRENHRRGIDMHKHGIGKSKHCFGRQDLQFPKPNSEKLCFTTLSQYIVYFLPKVLNTECPNLIFKLNL